MNFQNGLSPILNCHDLEKKLYSFSFDVSFQELFQDLCPRKDFIYLEDSYFDLSHAFQTAQIVGLLVPLCSVGDRRMVICCDQSMAQEILSHYDEKIVLQMTQLLDQMFFTHSFSEKSSDMVLGEESFMNEFEDSGFVRKKMRQNDLDDTK